MGSRGFARSRTFVPGDSCALALVVSLAGPVQAGPPVVTLSPNGVRIQVVATPLAEIIDTLARTASFNVSYDGARPSAVLFNADIEASSVPQALFRLLDGQNLNFGVVLDPSGTKVASVMILGATPKRSAGDASGSSRAQPQPFATPQSPRRFGPTRDIPAPVNEEAVEEAVEEPTEPAPSTIGVDTSPPPSPFAPRPLGSPFGPPYGPRPRPAPRPTPSA